MEGDLNIYSAEVWVWITKKFIGSRYARPLTGG